MLDRAITAFTWGAADSVGTTYAQDFGFKPRAIFPFCVGIASATNAVSGTLDGYRSFGIAADDAGTLVRWAIGSADDDAAATTNCGKIKRTDACLALPNFAGAATNGLLDIDSVNSGQGVFINDQAPPVDLRVICLAIGGSEITGIDTGEFDFGTLGATGNLTVNLSAGKLWTPSLVLIGHMVSPTAGNLVDVHAQIGIGAMCADGTQGMISVLSRDALATASTFGYCHDLECLGTLNNADGTTMHRASFVSMDPGSFTINRLQHLIFANSKYFYLALGGVPASVLGIVAPAAAGKATHNVPFTPRAVMTISANRAKDAQGTSSANDASCVGFAVNPGTRVAQGYLSETGTTGSEVDVAIETDSAIVSVTAAAGVDTLVDVEAMGSGKVDYVTDDAAAVTTFFLSLVLGQYSLETDYTGFPVKPIADRALGVA